MFTFDIKMTTVSDQNIRSCQNIAATSSLNLKVVGTPFGPYQVRSTTPTNDSNYGNAVALLHGLINKGSDTHSAIIVGNIVNSALQISFSPSSITPVNNWWFPAIT